MFNSATLSRIITSIKESIMVKSFLLLAIIGLSTTVSAQTYYTGWDTSTEVTGWNQIQKGDVGPYEWDFDFTSTVSPDSCLIHYYPVGGSVPTDNWFISPEFDFYGGGTIDSLYKNFAGFGTPMNGDTVALYLLNGSSDPDLATQTILYNFTDSAYFNDSQWRKDSAISIPATTGNSYLAFRYYTTNNWLDVRFDNLYVTAIPEPAAIKSEDQAQKINVFPNPTSQTFTLTLDKLEISEIKSIQLINANGQTVKSLKTTDAVHSISDLAPGVYTISISTVNQRINRTLVIGD